MGLPDILKWVLNFFELAAAIAGFYYLKKWKGTKWQLFPYLLLLTVITELIGKYMFYQVPLRSSQYIVYRYINIPATILFYLYMVYWSFISKSIKKAVLVVIGVYIASWLVEEFILKGNFLKRSTISYIIGIAGLLVFIIVWFAKLVRRAEVLQFKRTMYFWLYTGLLVYYIIMLPLTSELRYTLNRNYPDLLIAFWYLTMFFNYLMYSFFIIGFKCTEPKSSYPL